MAIRILIVDDHKMFRGGLKSLLSYEEDFQVVGEADSGSSALKLAKELKPDVVLLDISMPGISGLKILPRILAASPDAKVIMLTAFDNPDFLNEAIMAGSYGYILKSESHTVLVDAIREAHSGFRLLDRDQLNSFIQSVRKGEVKKPSDAYDLTDREIELLKLLSEGQSYEEISESMYLSVPTVKRNVNTIVSKMMVQNRVQAVAEAVRNGLI